MWHKPCTGLPQDMNNNRFAPAKKILLSDRAGFRAARPFFFLNS
jgi:hypothetical protein